MGRDRPGNDGLTARERTVLARRHRRGPAAPASRRELMDVAAWQRGRRTESRPGTTAETPTV